MYNSYDNYNASTWEIEAGKAGIQDCLQSNHKLEPSQDCMPPHPKDNNKKVENLILNNMSLKHKASLD